MDKILLGCTYRDCITGFQGVVTGYVEYISGCNQALLLPKSVDGKASDSVWMDVQRLRLVDDIARIVLDNGTTPGCDKAPPAR